MTDNVVPIAMALTLYDSNTFKKNVTAKNSDLILYFKTMCTHRDHSKIYSLCSNNNPQIITVKKIHS